MPGGLPGGLPTELLTRAAAAITWCPTSETIVSTDGWVGCTIIRPACGVHGENTNSAYSGECVCHDGWHTILGNPQPCSVQFLPDDTGPECPEFSRPLAGTGQCVCVDGTMDLHNAVGILDPATGDVLDHAGGLYDTFNRTVMWSPPGAYPVCHKVRPWIDPCTRRPRWWMIEQQGPWPTTYLLEPYPMLSLEHCHNGDLMHTGECICAVAAMLPVTIDTGNPVLTHIPVSGIASVYDIEDCEARIEGRSNIVTEHVCMASEVPGQVIPLRTTTFLARNRPDPVWRSFTEGSRQRLWTSQRINEETQVAGSIDLSTGAPPGKAVHLGVSWPSSKRVVVDSFGFAIPKEAFSACADLADALAPVLDPEDSCTPDDCTGENERCIDQQSHATAGHGPGSNPSLTWGLLTGEGTVSGDARTCPINPLYPDLVDKDDLDRLLYHLHGTEKPMLKSGYPHWDIDIEKPDWDIDIEKPADWSQPDWSRRRTIHTSRVDDTAKDVRVVLRSQLDDGENNAFVDRTRLSNTAKYCANHELQQTDADEAWIATRCADPLPCGFLGGVCNPTSATKCHCPEDLHGDDCMSFSPPNSISSPVHITVDTPGCEGYAVMPSFTRLRPFWNASGDGRVQCIMECTCGAEWVRTPSGTQYCALPACMLSEGIAGAMCHDGIWVRPEEASQPVDPEHRTLAATGIADLITDILATSLTDMVDFSTRSQFSNLACQFANSHDTPVMIASSDGDWLAVGASRKASNTEIVLRFARTGVVGLDKQVVGKSSAGPITVHPSASSDDTVAITGLLATYAVTEECGPASTQATGSAQVPINSLAYSLEVYEPSLAMLLLSDATTTIPDMSGENELAIPVTEDAVMTLADIENTEYTGQALLTSKFLPCADEVSARKALNNHDDTFVGSNWADLQQSRQPLVLDLVKARMKRVDQIVREHERNPALGGIGASFGRVYSRVHSGDARSWSETSFNRLLDQASNDRTGRIGWVEDLKNELATQGLNGTHAHIMYTKSVLGGWLLMAPHSSAPDVDMVELVGIPAGVVSDITQVVALLKEIGPRIVMWSYTDPATRVQFADCLADVLSTCDGSLATMLVKGEGCYPAAASTLSPASFT